MLWGVGPDRNAPKAEEAEKRDMSQSGFVRKSRWGILRGYLPRGVGSSSCGVCPISVQARCTDENIHSKMLTIVMAQKA